MSEIVEFFGAEPVSHPIEHNTVERSAVVSDHALGLSSPTVEVSDLEVDADRIMVLVILQRLVQAAEGTKRL